jgi:putative hydrolase of the HAD superfamily
VRAVLADLDDTLFDHRHATRAALAHLHISVPAFGAWPREALEARHADVLEVLHREVLAGRLSIEAARAERFRRLLEMAGAGPTREAGAGPAREHAAADGLEAAAALAQEYRRRYESAWQPVPGATALAAALTDAGIALVIVTNNVTREQQLKLDRCGLGPYVSALVTSEDVGVTKPDLRIFTTALDVAGAAPEEAVMLGDSWATDVVGALAAGVRPVWLNRGGTPPPGQGVAELPSLEPLDEVWRAVIGYTETHLT